MRVAIVVPHIFMHRDILPRVIFSPAELAISLAEGLAKLGVDVELCTPGPIDTTVRNSTADLMLFEQELAGRGYDFTTLLKKHPNIFIALARQVQSELLADVFSRANAGEFDIVHVYTNEEEIGLAFARLCNVPVVFTHHDPFNFLIKYKSSMPKYANLPWISLSYAQRDSMPKNTNWVGNIYHGLTSDVLTPVVKPSRGYVAYLGRIIEPKGVHLAITAVKLYNKQHTDTLQLRIAGKHYSDHGKDAYWTEIIEPEIDGKEIFYDGFLATPSEKRAFLGNAEALVVPSVFAEPFGMVSIEALACGTPVIGLDSGAIPEVLSNPAIGMVVQKINTTEGALDDEKTAAALARAMAKRRTLSRKRCRKEFEDRFTVERMCIDHIAAYKQLIK